MTPEVVDVRILVTGGTGQLGSAVVARLRAAGEEVRVLSRRAAPDVVRGDLRTGRGIDSAVAGVDVVVHCATDYFGREAALAARWSRRPAGRVSRTWSTCRSSASTASRSATTGPSTRPKS